jgi:hypothetical protein
VTESAGNAIVTVIKKETKKEEKITFGVRTIKDTAKPDLDYTEID